MAPLIPRRRAAGLPHGGLTPPHPTSQCQKPVILIEFHNHEDGTCGIDGANEGISARAIRAGTRHWRPAWQLRRALGTGTAGSAGNEPAGWVGRGAPDRASRADLSRAGQSLGSRGSEPGKAEPGQGRAGAGRDGTGAGPDGTGAGGHGSWLGVGAGRGGAGAGRRQRVGLRSRFGWFRGLARYWPSAC
jgi:hypothetical protein